MFFNSSKTSGSTKDGGEVLKNDFQTKELNKDKEITLHERKNRGDDQDDFGVAKRFLQPWPTNIIRPYMSHCEIAD